VGSRINIKCFSSYSWEVWEAAMVPLSVLILALVICQGGGCLVVKLNQMGDRL
jgi:hypothetical protein